MLSVIKNIFSRKKLIIFLFLFIIIVLSTLSYLENNIQNIISNQFSKNSNYSVKLDDVDFNFSGDLSFDNVIIFNNNKDTLFYSPKILVNPTSVQNAVINNEYDFDKIVIQKGSFFIENFNDFDEIEKSYSLNSENKLLIKTLLLNDFRIINSDNTNNINFDINDFIISKNNIDFSLKNSNIKLNEIDQINSINSNVNISKDNLNLNDVSLVYKNSNINLNVFIEKTNNLDSVIYYGDIKNSRIISSNFISGSIDNSFNLNLNFIGNKNEIILNNLELENEYTEINTSIIIKDPFSKSFNNIELDFKEFNSSSFEISKTFPNIFGSILPSSLESIGRFSLKGFINYSNDNIISNFELFNNNGKIFSALNISDFDNIDNAKYVGTFKGDNINLSNFITLPFLGKSNFEFTIDGQGFIPEFLNSQLNGKIQSLEINEYVYNEISVFGNVSDKIFNGELKVNDDNLIMNFTGLIDYSDELIDFDFSTQIIDAKIGNLKITNDLNNFLSGEIKTKLRGTSISDLIGDVSFSNFKYNSGDIKYSFDELLAQSRINNNKRFYNINSPDAINGIIIGDLNFLKFNEILKNYVLSNYENFDPIDESFFDDFSFNLNLKPKIASVINSDITIDENTFLRGNFNQDKSFEVFFTSSYLKSKDIVLENIDLKINDKYGVINLDKLKSKLFNGNNVKLVSDFKDDKTNILINFNSINGANKISFNHTIDENNRTVFSFLDISFDYNKNKWILDKSNQSNKNKLILSKNYKELKSTKITSNDQIIEFKYLNNEDKFDFESIFKNVGFSSLLPRPKNILYEGLVNGNISLSKDDGIYSSQSKIILENFSSNGFVLGDGFLDIISSESKDKYDIEFKIVKNNLNTFHLDGFFKIDDNDYPIDLNVKTNNFLIKPFSAIGEEVLQNFEGYFDSNFNITGTFYKPNFEGYLTANDSSFDVPYLGVRYSFPENPSFKLNEMSIYMEGFKIQDVLKNSHGILNGQINHNRLKDWFLDFNIISENLLAIKTSYDDNDFYYGTGYLNGSAKFYGPGKDLDINISGSTNKETKITIPIKYDDGVGNLSYLKFSSNDNTTENIINQGLEVNVNLNLNDNAELEIIFDENSGSKISGRGNGDFIFESDYSGKFNIKGDFITNVGKYHFKNFGFVERIFEIKKGANITWDGDPYKGIINAEAIYEVPGGANPAALIQNASFNRKIPTFVNVYLLGELSNLQTPKFDISFPNTRGSIKSELEYYLNDYENKQTQAISLISQGFFTESGNNSIVSSQTITNNLFQRASGIIDEIFTNPDDKMNVGINFSQGDKFSSSSLLNRDRIGLSLQSEISDRILINGKIGVPVSGTEENVILGDVQIEFLLNDTGNLKARIFNKENEYQFFGDEIGYTQGIGISYDVEFDSFSELIQKIRKKKKK